MTSATIKATTSIAAPAYMSLTALSTVRGGLARSTCCGGSETGYGSYILFPYADGLSP